MRVGDLVRVVSLSQSFLNSLPPDEVEDVRSMIGEKFTVEEIDEHGSAWVSKWWNHGEGQRSSHTVGLEASEMELISGKNAN